MNLGEKLRFWCLSRYKTLADASMDLGIASPTLQRYINMENLPGTPLLIKLCERGCNLNWLLGQDIEMNIVEKEKVEMAIEHHLITTEVEKLRMENEALKRKIKLISKVLEDES